MSSEERKEKWDETGKQDAVRVGSILLKDADIDFDALCDTVTKAFLVAEENYKREDGILVFEVGSNMITMSLVDAPVPDGQAEFYAEGNFLWREAVAMTKQHRAHMIVAVMNHDGNSIEAASFFTDVMNLCSIETDAYYSYLHIAAKKLCTVFSL